MARTTNHRRGQEGAVAIMVALLAVVILGVGAFAVDMGQVYAKRAALQSNVDLAVLAATAELDNDGDCNAEVVDAATEYLLKDGNEVADQIAVDLGGAPGDDDGFIRCDDWRVELWAPRAHVEFGLAKAFVDDDPDTVDMTGVDVPAVAAAEVRSPAASTSLPMYAVSGCDLGNQTVTDPPSGPASSPTVPVLTPNTSTYNSARVTELIANEAPTGTVAPYPITLKGNQLSSTTKVGFTTADGSHFEVSGAGLTSVSNTQVTIDTVPADVLAADGIWYVRVFKDSKWSKNDEAQPFTVGDLMFCNGSVSGNFGTLKISRSTPSGWLEDNIMYGMEPTLALYPDLSATSCDDGVSPAITSEHRPPNDGTNCVGTDPGFPNAAATTGLITGDGAAEPGRLDKDTTGDCSRSNDGSRTATTPAGVTLNDDLLTCFLIGDTTTVQDAIDGEEGIISADIFSSPRFFRMPVIPVEAANGSSNFYPIVGFRPGFITDQATTASRQFPGSVSSYNGIDFHSGHVKEVKVVFFDEAALPETAPAVGGEVAYTGSGTKVIVLVE